METGVVIIGTGLIARFHEEAVQAGLPDPGALDSTTAAAAEAGRGRVYDLFLPMAVLTVACIVGMIHSGTSPAKPSR